MEEALKKASTWYTITYNINRIFERPTSSKLAKMVNGVLYSIILNDRDGSQFNKLSCKIHYEKLDSI